MYCYCNVPIRTAGYCQVDNSPVLLLMFFLTAALWACCSSKSTCLCMYVSIFVRVIHLFQSFSLANEVMWPKKMKTTSPVTLSLRDSGEFIFVFQLILRVLVKWSLLKLLTTWLSQVFPERALKIQHREKTRAQNLCPNPIFLQKTFFLISTFYLYRLK